MVTINVDGKEYKVPEGINVVDAVEEIGIEIPHYCYHSHLSVAGNCRMCLVEMGMPMRDRATGEPVMDDDGKQKIQWNPKPGIACASNTSQGLHIRTDSELTKSCREGVMEFLLVNHPLVCPICHQAGECSLQEFSTDYGRGFSRYTEAKNVKPKKVVLGPRITLDDERCILCSRCVRFCEEVDKKPVLGFNLRGSHSTLSCYPGKELDSNYSLNTVDLCPVGALTSTDFRFKMLVWFLKPVDSICTESSAGVNTEVWSREGKIYRITPRRNDAVNDSWMSDSGRTLFHNIDADDRLKRCKVNGNAVSLGEGVLRTSELLKGGNVAYVGSGHLSVEEQWMIKRLLGQAQGEVNFVHHQQSGDGRLISNDATPNLRGALMLGLIDKLPQANLDTLADKVRAGEVKTILSFGEDLTKLGFDSDLLKKVDVIYFGTHENPTSEQAVVVMPTLSVFEKSGRFINQQFRLQRFNQCVPGPAGLLPSILVLHQVIEQLADGKMEAPSLNQIWDEISKSIPQFENISYKSIPKLGQQLDASAFENVDFCEADGLHYKTHSNLEIAS